jgi:hypothetical protein
VRSRPDEQRVRHRLVDLLDARVIRPAGAVAPELLDKQHGSGADRKAFRGDGLTALDEFI